MRAAIDRASRQVVIPGVGLGIFGLLAFLATHHVLIAPIWTRAGRGSLMALGGGIAIAWAWELRRRRANSVGAALAFGAGIWIALIPVTLFGAYLQMSGLRAKLDSWEAPLEIAVAFLTGAAIGWLLDRSWRSTVIHGGVLVAVLVMMVGPIPLTNNRRSFLLFVSFLPIYAAGALVLYAARNLCDREPAA